jgi:hypothetical protein
MSEWHAEFQLTIEPLGFAGSIMVRCHSSPRWRITPSAPTPPTRSAADAGCAASGLLRSARNDGERPVGSSPRHGEELLRRGHPFLWRARHGRKEMLTKALKGTTRCSRRLFHHKTPTPRVRSTPIAVEAPRSLHLLTGARDRLGDGGREFVWCFQRGQVADIR